MLRTSPIDDAKGPRRAVMLLGADASGPSRVLRCMKPTWKPHEEHGKLSSEERKELPETVYAFPTKRKEPMTDASHVRNAIARFDQVKDVTDADRDQAFANLQAAAKHYDVEMVEKNWRELGKKPHTPNPVHKH